MKHAIISIIWLVFAIIILGIDMIDGSEISPMFYAALICSQIWVARGETQWKK
jgi:hypothetical protein